MKWDRASLNGGEKGEGDAELTTTLNTGLRENVNDCDSRRHYGNGREESVAMVTPDIDFMSRGATTTNCWR